MLVPHDGERQLMRSPWALRPGARWPPVVVYSEARRGRCDVSGGGVPVRWSDGVME